MSNDILDALSSEDDFSPIFKFTNAGDHVKGVIVEEPKTFPVNEYQTTTPKVGADGKPVMQVLLVLATDQPADDTHDGRWRVYLDKPLMKLAVRKALKDAGDCTLEVGGELSLEFTGYRETRGGGSAKEFTAKYSPVEPDPWGPIGTAEVVDGDGDPVGA